MSERQVVWHGHPTATAPLQEIRRERSATVVDGARQPVAFGALQFAWQAARAIGLKMADAVVATVATLLSNNRSPAAREAKPGPGPTVLIVPILPDLSHTFVFREVLTILERHPDWHVIALEHNRHTPVHDEAKRVMQHATFLPREGIARRTLRALKWLCRRRGRELFSLYRAQPDGSVRDLLGKNPLRDARHPGNTLLLADMLAGKRPKHVHVYSSTYAANVAMGAALLLDLPFSISSYVDFEFDYDHKMLAEKLRRARFFRVVSQFCKQRLRELPDLPELADEQTPVVDFGLAVSEWTEQAELKGNNVLVSAARLVPKKGFHLVPEALAKLRERGIQCHWRLLGDGPERPRLEALCDAHGVRDAVDFLGACDNATVRSELLASDIALLPCVVTDDGERDGIPVFLVEAMSLCVPVVTTPVAGIPEIVEHEKSGYLSTPESVEELVDLLQRVLANRDEAVAIGRAGRQSVLTKFDVQKTANQLADCVTR